MSLYGQRRNCARTQGVQRRLEVDKAKIDVISKLPPPTNIKASYLILSKLLFITDHSALGGLIQKADAKPLLSDGSYYLQEVDIEIKD
ncbi:hypothetical protein Tco_1202583 [Tanacetum coccineum]|uniref:Uncharacterized protein n=1 Tax=Tanacetum coccineum TaxID=301880 RepID=A0ABQ5IEZ6_9ASTR